MNVAASIEYGERHFGEKAAIEWEGESISYRQLNQSANRAAQALRAMGVGPGDRVALVLPTAPLFLYAYFGILKLGAIAVSVNPALTRAEAGYMVQDSGARIVIDESTWFERLLSTPAPDLDAIEMDENAPAAIVYTSGTTGFPKGATLSHGNIHFNAASKKRYLEIRPSDRLLLFLPLFHCFGQNAIMNAAVHSGASIVLQDGFEADRVLECLASGRANMFFGVPTNFAILLDKATIRQLAAVRLFFSAAAPLPEELEIEWRRRFGSEIFQGYGLTETSPFASYNHLIQHRPGSVGSAIEGVEMAIADVTDGRLLPPGERGEIVIRGPNVMLGYWNRPQETAESIRDGWFHSGDIGRMDASGYFTVEDRLKDMIIIGGSNVYPAEVEKALLQHPAVAEAAAFGIRDAVLGERVRAAVVCKRGAVATAAELLLYCREQLAAYKVPSEIEFLAELPKNRTGKVLKRVLRERPEQIVSSMLPLVTNAHDLERRLMDWLSEKLGQRIGESERRRPFCDLGLTSLMAVELARMLSEATGLTMTPTITWSFSSVESLMRHVFENDHIKALSEEEAEAMLLKELALLER